jgi:ATP-dependent Clp protease ATP-binding subunit ClpC
VFEAFDEPARRVVFFARYEASRLGSPSIQPEHLLLGILREGRKVAVHLRDRGFDLDLLRKQIEEAVTRAEPVSTAVDIPLTSDAKEALEIALEEGRANPLLVVGVEELLIGVFREGRSAAARLLAEGGFDPQPLRKTARPGDAPRPCRRCGAVPLAATTTPVVRLSLPRDPGSTPPQVSLGVWVCPQCGLVEWNVGDVERLYDH